MAWQEDQSSRLYFHLYHREQKKNRKQVKAMNLLKPTLVMHFTRKAVAPQVTLPPGDQVFKPMNLGEGIFLPKPPQLLSK